MKLNRRQTLAMAAAASAAGLIGIRPAFAQAIDAARIGQAPEGITDYPVGEESAPVTVIEYASPFCPHCANFHNMIYPAFKEKYIDSGQVRFIVRPFTANIADAVIFMLAEASGPDMYNNVLATYFATQQTWRPYFIEGPERPTDKQPREALMDVALQLGFTVESFEAALTNQDYFAALEAAREQALNEYQLRGTPAFYINGSMHQGDYSLESLSGAIDPLLS